jgi:hypothetical protein
MVQTAAATKATQSASYSETPPLDRLFLTEAQLVKELPTRGVKVTVRTLKYWRSVRTGPDWTKLGRTVVYKRQDVLDWLDRNKNNLQREQPPIRRRRSRGAR